MSNPRLTGLLLLLIGVLTLVGNTMDILPPQSFWAGLLTYPIGGYLFLKGSRQSFERAELRTAEALNPRIKNPTGDASARQPVLRIATQRVLRAAEPQVASDVHVQIEGFDDEPSPWNAGAPDAGDSNFEVATDVSFPLEIQERTHLADQLEKLAKLQQQGIISAEELTVAKAKLLG